MVSNKHRVNDDREFYNEYSCLRQHFSHVFVLNKQNEVVEYVGHRDGFMVLWIKEINIRNRKSGRL